MNNIYEKNKWYNYEKNITGLVSEQVIEQFIDDFHEEVLINFDDNQSYHLQFKIGITTAFSKMQYYSITNMNLFTRHGEKEQLMKYLFTASLYEKEGHEEFSISLLSLTFKTIDEDNLAKKINDSGDVELIKEKINLPESMKIVEENKKN